MVSLSGIEYMAGGTGSHRMIGTRALVGSEQQHQKQIPWGRENQKTLSGAEVSLTMPTSSYTAKADLTLQALRRG